MAHGFGCGCRCKLAHRGIELAARADNVGLGSAFIGEAEDAAYVIEGKFLAVVKEHDARFEFVERLENEAPIVAAALFHLERFVDVVRGRVGNFVGLRFGDPDRLGGPALYGGEAAVARDDIEPRGEAAIAAIFVEIAVGAEQNFLREVGGGFAVARKAGAPSGNAALVTLE